MSEETTSSTSATRILAESWAVGLVTFVLLCLIRGHVLSLPLYEDQSVGFGREADFLEQNNFDYLKLRYQEQHFMFGGTARSYMVSAIPTTLALIHRATGSTPRTIWIWHLISFLCAAGIASLFYSIVRSSLNRWPALLAVACVLSTPMFLAQVDVAGMELPLVLMTLLAGRSLMLGHESRAILLSIVAFFMKASGLLVLASVTLVITGQHLLRPNQPRRGWAPLAGACSFAILVALLWWADDTALFRATFYWPSSLRFPRAFLWCPDLFLLVGLAILLAIAVSYRRWSAISPFSQGSANRITLPAESLLLWATLIVLGALASMAGYIFIPRYYILPLVLVYLVLTLLVSADHAVRRVYLALLLGILVLNGINHAGMLYPQVGDIAGDDFKVRSVFTERSCAFTERSLEYQADHASTIEAVRTTGAAAQHATVFAEMPHWVYLNFPFVGYVDQPVPDLVRADQFTTVVRAFRDRAMLTPPDHDLIFLWSEKGSVRMPLVDDQVEILNRDTLPSPLVVYRVRRSALPTTSNELEEWFLDHTWDAELALHRATDRYDFLRRTGRIERAERELHFARWLFPNPADPDVVRAVTSMTLELSSARSLAVRVGNDPWMLMHGPQAAASLAPNRSATGVELSLQQLLGTDRSTVRLLGPRRFVRPGQTVNITFRIRATRSCSVRVFLTDAFGHFEPVGFEEELIAGETPTTVQRSITIEPGVPDAQLVFELAHPNVRFEIDDISFEPLPLSEASAPASPSQSR